MKNLLSIAFMSFMLSSTASARDLNFKVSESQMMKLRSNDFQQDVGRPEVTLKGVPEDVVKTVEKILVTKKESSDD